MEPMGQRLLERFETRRPSALQVQLWRSISRSGLLFWIRACCVGLSLIKEEQEEVSEGQSEDSLGTVLCNETIRPYHVVNSQLQLVEC